MNKSERLAKYTERYEALKAELAEVGFAFPGSIHTRLTACGTATCRCHADPDKRHGPYSYWTRKAHGKTVGLLLTDEEFPLYREWVGNNRKLVAILREMREVSASALTLRTGRKVP